MAAPAEPRHRTSQPIELPLLEARTRFVHLVRVTATTGQSFVITDRGQPAATLMPAKLPVDEEPDDRARAAAQGWQRRIEQVRATLISQHTAELKVAHAALAEVWTLLDRTHPNGADPDVDRLRAAHRDALSRLRRDGAGGSECNGVT
jgi:prevent-host-death family protein